MKLSRPGLAFIARFEGYRRLGYNAGDGLYTIGYGHVCGPWSKRAVYRARYPFGVSQKAALRLLRQDAAAAESAVRTYVKRPVRQCEFDALVSFTFNCGAGALAHSTLLQDVKRDAPAGTIRSDFLRWDHVGGVVWPGLTRRREAEANVYIHGRYQ